MKPDALSECIERLIESNTGLLQAIQDNTAAQSQLFAGLQELRLSIGGLEDLASERVSRRPASANALPNQASHCGSIVTKEQPVPELAQEEFAGLIFALFCHHGPGPYSQDLLREWLESRISSLTFAVVYREGMAIGAKYTDKPAGNPTRYWRISLEGKHLLLPCPAKPEAFYGVEGFVVSPLGSTIGPGTIEYCLPALLSHEGDAWYIESKGQLCSALPPGRVNWRDYVHLANPQAPPTSDHVTSNAQPQLLPQPIPPLAPPTVPLPERLAQAYVSFCKGNQNNRLSFSDMQELWRQSAGPDQVMAHRVLRESERLLVADHLKEGKEHFWLVREENCSTSGWLFPCVKDNQFGILEPAYSGRDYRVAPENLAGVKPATVSKALTVQGQPSPPWRITAKGELYRK